VVAGGVAEQIKFPTINQLTPLHQAVVLVMFWREQEGYVRFIMRGLTEAAFEAQFGTEEACLATLVAARQAAGMPCPRCANPKSYVYGRRVGCTRCDQRWSVTSGTIMDNTKLDLTQWFRAMHLMTSTKQGISALELGRRLGVSYPTAWYLLKRLRHAMTERGDRYMLGAPPSDGSAGPTVEADEVYIGGERNEGHGTAGKARVIAACERQPGGAMGYVVMKVVESFRSEHVIAFRDAHIAPGAHVHTDGLHGFKSFADPATERTHTVTITGSKRPERARGSAFFWVNTAIANLSTAIKATYKAPSPKHLPDYLGAFCWTTNHRRHMPGMIASACRAIATSTSITRKSAYAPAVGSTG
jgi:transposase-like protein